MPSKPVLQPETKNRIFGALDINRLIPEQQRLSQAAIARHYEVSEATVSLVRMQHLDGGEPIVKKKPCRSLTATSQQDRNRIRLLALRNEGISLRRIQEQLPSRVGLETIRQILIRANIVHRNGNRKPLLTKKHRDARLDWAKKRKDWTVDDFKRVVYTDEVSIRLHRPETNPYGVWRPKGKEYGTMDRYSRLQAPGGSNMTFWGGFSESKATAMVPFPPGYKSPDYIALVLDGELRSFVDGRFGVDQQPTVLEDNASWHTSKESRAAFVRQRYRRHEHCIRSPDLNPIENLWRHVKEQYWREHSQFFPYTAPKNKELKARLGQRLAPILSDIFRQKVESMGPSLVESMPRRVQAVIEAEGGHIDY